MIIEETLLFPILFFYLTTLYLSNYLNLTKKQSNKIIIKIEIFFIQKHQKKHIENLKKV